MNDIRKIPLDKLGYDFIESNTCLPGRMNIIYATCKTGTV
jgi:hypothetical protein